MPVEVILPKVDMDMATGTVSVWHVAEGDTVVQGEALFDIETDKAAMEVESPASGTLHHKAAVEGDEIPIGQTVAWIYSEGEDVPENPPKITEAKVEAKTQAVPDNPSLPSAAAPHDAKRATPAARKLARNAGVSLADISGSGPRSRVQQSDVQTALKSEPVPAQTDWAADAAPLNVLRSGAGDATPWLMIHGLGGDASSWALVEKQLAASAPVFRLELPCHGKSPHHKVESFAQLAAQVRGAFDELNLNRVRLIGHSLGGALAMALADTRPRNVEALTLIAPAGLGPQINGEILGGIIRASTTESLGPWLRMTVGDPDLITDNYVQAAMAARKDPDLRRAQTQTQNAVFPDHTQSFDLSAALHRLTCPTRIIFGKMDQVIPWSHALKAPGHISLNLFPDLGHLPHVEDPESVLALL